MSTPCHHMCAAWNYSSINRLQHILYSVSLRVHLISLMHNVGQHSRDINKKAIPQSQLVELMQTQNQCILCQLLQICTFGWQLRDPKCAVLKSCGLGWSLSACTGEFKHSGYANVAQSFKRKSHKSNLWLQH